MIFCAVMPDKLDVDIDVKQYVIPVSLQVSLMRKFHEEAGHWAATKVVQLLKSRGFYWPGMKKHIDNYVFGCVTCGVAKNSRKTPLP